VFAAWYAGERTLSIHTIYTTRREAFYWLAVSSRSPSAPQLATSQPSA